MSSHANDRNGGMLLARNERSMPKWVSEQSDRIGPKPPPPPLTPENGHDSTKQPSLPPKTKTQPEPDYEVIEFSNQQYSNAPLRPNSASSGSKTPDNKLKCTLCGSGNPWVTCEECAQQLFCASCDDMFHKHPKRKDHQRKTIDKSRPPLPPKVLPGQAGPTPPVAPPRRNKRGLMTPIMQRKDQGNAMPGPFPVPSSPTPSMKNSSWQERFGSLPRGLNLLNRPLPETPKTPSESSRSTTPKSVFDNIQRPPSVALEKIKSKANATLDRMQLLQQRYRQQKEQMERERSGSITDQRQMALQHHQMATQRANQLGQRTMSSSVFNLNQINRKQPVTNSGWNNPLQQAQSMAQLNCANCAHQQSQWNSSSHHHHHMHMPQDPWSNQLSSQQHLNRSNMSLNVPAGYMMQPQMNGMYPPPTFMNQRGLMQQIYPQPYLGGMPIMNPGLVGMPPSTSRAPSRAGSRMASPAMSRKSVTLRRKQHSSYIDGEATDDEDSDEDDRRSITSIRSGVSRSRQRRMSSASQIQLDDDIESSHVKSHRHRARNQRRDSLAKSVHNDWAPGRRTSSSNNNRSADSGFNSPLKPSRIYSDLDSEGSGTKALVQAKIEQKLKEESLKQKQSKHKRQSQSPPPQKTSAAVQTPAIKQTTKHDKINKFVDEPVKQVRKPSESASEKDDQDNEKKESLEVQEEKNISTEEEEESESVQSEEPKQETEEIEENNIEEDDLGPPPSTPDHEWECEFCTFFNEANIKICSICCKTPSIKPKKATKSITPPKQIKTPTVKKEKEHAMEKQKAKEREPFEHKSGTIKKKPSTSTHSSTSQNTVKNNTESLDTTKNIQATKVEFAHNTNDGHDSTTNTLQKKESVEDIWATLDENIQATAHEVTRKAESKKPSKVSTACGTTSKSASVERLESDTRQSQAREIGTSPPPQSISTQTYDTLPVHKPETRNEVIAKPTSQPLQNDMVQESDLYKYTTEELNAALKYCGPDMHPLVWLRDNWPKLIQTVQSLATKYGQERAENTIGTISQIEARDALRMHTGNIWQAVSECIEQRQRKYRDISSKGNFSREDIVTALTTHQGNVEMALLDLGRTQLKPFLMRIWGSPGGVENESGSQPLSVSSHLSQPTQYNMDKDIHNFLSANASDCMQTPNATGAFPTNNQMPSPFDRPESLYSPFDNNTHMLDNTSSYSADSKDFNNSPLPIDESLLSNKNVLKDLETLIGNMEHNQQKQNEQVLRSIHDMINNANHKNENEYDAESMRILTKSPITSPKSRTSSKDNNTENDGDVKNFVWQHIQEIVPNLVQQVEMELMEDIEDRLKSNKNIEEKRETTPDPIQIIPPPPPPPIDQDEFLMEEVIKPNIKNASIREELPPQYLYTSEIATFQLAFDKGLEREHEEEFEFETLKEAPRQIYRMFRVPEAQNETTMEKVVDIEEPFSGSGEKTEVKDESSPEAQSDALYSETLLSDKNMEVNLVQKTLFSAISTETLQTNNEIPNSTEDIRMVENHSIIQSQLLKINNESLRTFEDVDLKNALLAQTNDIPSPPQKLNLPETVPELITSSNTKTDIFSNKNSETQSSASKFQLKESIENPSISTQILLEETNAQKTVTAEIHNDITTNNEISNQKQELLNLPQEIAAQSVETSVKDDSNSKSINNNQFSPSVPLLNHDTQNQTNDKQINTPLLTEKRKPVKESKIRIKNSNQYKGKIINDLSMELVQVEPTTNEALDENVPYSIVSEEPSSINELITSVSDSLQVSEILQFSTTPSGHETENIIEGANSTSDHTQASQETNKNATPNSTEVYQISSVQHTEHNGPPLIPTTLNKIVPVIETKISGNKRISKIPIRRTASNKSLINSTIILTNTNSNEGMKSQERNLSLTPNKIESPKPPPDIESILTNDESEDEELYSVKSDTSATEVTSSRTDQLQSPSTTSEMFLVIQQEGAENNSTIEPSTSSSTLHSIISQSSSLKSPNEFIPSGDPSKQNLTELVEDTQRLIKQMKDEISIDDFESSTDEGEYSDEYSDEYDDEEEGEEEEEDEDWVDDEDDEEYNDITEDITEENEVFSIEEDSNSKTESPLLSLEHQNYTKIHNSSALFNFTESSDHIQASISPDYFEQVIPITTEINDMPKQIISVEKTAAFIETENNLPELPVETVIDDNLEESLSSMKFVESENKLPELPVETVFQDFNTLSQNIKILTTQQHSNTQQDSEDKTELVSGLRDILSASISIANELETENGLPELPVEAVAASLTHTEDLGSDMVATNSLELLAISQNENQSTSLKKTETLNDLNKKTNFGEKSMKTLDDPLSTLTIQHSPEEEAINKEQTEAEFLPTSQKTITSTYSTTTQDDLPSTSNSNKISLKSLQKPLEKSKDQGKTSETKDDNIPSTSRSVKSSETKKKSSEEIKISQKKPLTASKIPKPKEIPKETKPKETPTSKTKNEPKKKFYTRSKSFSGPPTPIGITSVKTISQKFINPTQNNTQPMTPKKFPTAARKSSIVEAINKLTKPPTSTEKSAVSSLFKSRTQPRIPKKKYHETCFSDDDYESSTSEEEMEPLEVRQRKLSVPVFRAYPSVQEPEVINTEELVEKFMKEELATTIAEAQIAATLVSMKFQQDVSLWAAKECSDLEHAIALLKQECELCSGTYALNQIVSMLKCTHKCCKQCAKTYFTVQITERSINDCSCPFCKLPELHNQTEHEDENLEYFSNLDIFLKNILEPEIHELFQRKLRDRTLLKDPNFKWCVQCSSGFFARPKQKRLICPDCGSVTCAQCRKPWQKQHEGISCDQYSEWESANDPELQAKGVQQHLEQHGIDCPKCKFRYSLARGGCMHFTCTQCKYEFCYGCARPFMMGAKCTISPYCAKLGLHAHHPRNCLFYLRDKLPVQLQILLKNNDVSFEVDPINAAGSANDNEPSSSKKKELLCPIPIQKETPTGLVDTKCNGDVPEKHAGMCRTHYVEYLTAKVAKAKIDPLPIFDLTDCVQELRRRGIALPERGPWDTDEIYKNMCAEVIQQNIPLDVD